MTKAWCAGILIGLAVFTAAPAQADPDPHLPDITSNYCPGFERGGMWNHVCGGVNYPDGSHWVDVQYFVPWVGPADYPSGPGRHCVNQNGSALAPPGGCGGGA